MDSMGSVFLKFILEDTIEEGKFMLPRKFARQYANSLSNPVTLKLSSGAAWQVELLKNEKDVWLYKGWREFAQHYSLDIGDTVVFKYEKNSHFHVFIYEDEYGDGDEGEDEYGDEDEDEDEDVIELDCEKIGSKKARLYIFQDGSEPANNFITENPSFHLVVKSYHLERENVYVPNSFMQELKDITETENMLLQVADKVKIWPVNVRFYPLKKMGCITSGFRTFARENSLQPRDVCVFQLISSHVLKVSIFRNAS
ncbi:B3 domain-containing protein At4g01580-like [Manihot esculenta]|uniref:B3 domain-containing protein At4g01580-like n=1 Tax=Manihot esculenta TaxID=3983 RepID=UPI000B5D7521|nr:B3 domain-containing protein At4g01580-like [Manihot esculenta]